MISEPVAQRRKSLTTYVPYLLFGLSAVIFYAVVFRFALNIPDVDDYVYLFSTIRMIDPATSGREALRLLFEQHNDHRIVLSRIIALADYAVEGHVNFRTLILLASLSVAGLFGYLWRLFRRAGLSAWAMLPVALLLFQFSYYDNICWTLSALQHTVNLLGYFILFGLVLTPSVRAQAGALALGALLLYSNSNGLFAWMVAVGLLAFRGQWRWAGVWLALGVVLIGAYFSFGYDFRSQSSFSVIIQHPAWLVKSVVSFLGASAYLGGLRWLYLPAPYVVYATGTLVLLVLGWAGLKAIFHKKYGQDNAFMTLLAGALVLLATAGAAALTRSDGNLLVADRYQLYALFSLLTAYGLALALLAENRRRPVVWLFSVGAAWFYLHSWAYYPLVLKNRESKLIAKTYSLQQYGKAPVSDLFLLDPFWQNLWQKSLRTGLYRFPETPLTGIGPMLREPSVETASGSFQITKDVDLNVSHPIIRLRSRSSAPPEFVVIRSDAETHILPVLRFPPARPLSMLTQTYASDFESFVYAKAVAPGRYQIGLLQLKPTPAVQWSDQWLTNH